MQCFFGSKGFVLLFCDGYWSFVIERMFGVQIFYLLLFATFQVSTGSYLVALQRSNKLINPSSDIVLMAAIFFIYNVVVILDLCTNFNLIEGALLILPSTLLWYFTRRKRLTTYFTRSKNLTNVILLVSLFVTVVVWFVLKHVAGIEIEGIAPTLIIIYSITGILLTNHLQMAHPLRWLILIFITSGFVLLLLTSILFSIDGGLGTHLIVNFIYIIILLEFVIHSTIKLSNTSEDLSVGDAQWSDGIVSDKADLIPSNKYPSLDKYDLTVTQKMIAEFLLDGLSFQDIANKTEKKVNTLYQHAHKVYRKTGTTQQTFLLTFRNLEENDELLSDSNSE